MRSAVYPRLTRGVNRFFRLKIEGRGFPELVGHTLGYNYPQTPRGNLSP